MIEPLFAGVLALLGWMIKENTKALNKLSLAVQFCPNNQKNKKKIKG